MRAATILCLAALAALGGCDGGDEPAGDARQGGSVIVGASVVPEILDPALADDPLALQALWLVYTPPVSYRHAEGADGTDLIPGIARELPDVSDDGLTYSFVLRRGLRYSNGARVVAADFERAVGRMRALRSPHAELYAGVRSIEANDRSGRVTVTLERPDPTFLHVLALPSSAPVPKGTRPEDLSRKPPPGVGPYAIGDVRHGQRMVLLRERGFQLSGLPAGQADRIVLRRFGPPERQAQAIVTATPGIDLSQEPPPADLLPDIRAKYERSYREEPTAATLALQPDISAPPFDDERVRRAVAHAIDGAKLARLYAGRLEPSCNILPAVVAGYVRIDPCPYGEPEEPPDLIRARELVEEAGAEVFPVGVHADRDAAPPAVARYLTRTLRKIGLRARLGGSGSPISLARTAPLAAHPAAFLGDFATPAMLAQPSLDEAEDDWAALDERLVDEAIVAPLGSERRPAFLSGRLDAENCFRFHPVFGVDLASLCLK